MTDEQKEKEEREETAGTAGEPTDSEAEEERDEVEDDDDDEPEEEQGSEKSSKSQVKIWIAIAIGVVIALVFVFKPGESAQSGPGAARVGSTVDGDLTLVTADRNDLECAAPKGFESYQCGFADEKQARTLDEKVKLRPYMTLDRQLFLIPGLFLEPAVAQRFSTEPPNKPRNELKRFTAKCKITIVGELDGVKLRWQPEMAWEPAKKFPVATVSGCSIQG